VYASAQSTSTFGALYKIERSDDGGATFTDLTAGTPNYMGGQGWYDTTLIVDPSNSAIVYAAGAAGSNSVLRSTNSGVAWTDISSGAGGQGPHADHHAAAFDANGDFLDGDDGGIYRYHAATNTWTQLNGTATFLNTIQFQGIGLHPSNINNALGGSQDNGTEQYTGTLSWTLVEGGDGGFVKFSKTNPLRVYGMCGLTVNNCKANLKSLQTKLAIEPEAGYSSTTGTTYLRIPAKEIGYSELMPIICRLSEAKQFHVA
jgi:hypothetical protein